MILLWELINAFSSSWFFLTMYVLEYQNFRYTPETTLLPWAVQRWPQIFPPSGNAEPALGLPTAILLAFPSLMDSSFKLSRSAPLAYAQNVFSQSAPSTPSVSKAPPWFKSPKFWQTHQSQSQVLMSWAHLFLPKSPPITMRVEVNTMQFWDKFGAWSIPT